MSLNAFALLLRAIVLISLGLLCGSAAWAQDDPPGRVGRLAELNGGVSRYDIEQGQWAAAERNRPLTSGDRISTARDGRAVLRVGSTVLRLSNSTELELVQIDDDKLVFQLHRGSLALRLRSREVASEVELLTAEARLLPQRAGHYRLDRVDDDTWAGVWRGELRVDELPGVVLGDGQRLQLSREGSARTLRQRADAMPTRDGFTAWVSADDADEERTAASRYVSPEMTGAEELERSGRWDTHPEYGTVWLPQDVRADWAPYRDGRWVWVTPWGWTWVDNAPWGFAPFHYGRWVLWGSAWCWVPGPYVARPVFAPALVAWQAPPGWSATVRIGIGPGVSWLPLAPREPFRPPYRHTPRYVERVNPWLGPPRPGFAPRPEGPRPGWRPEPGRPGPRPEVRPAPRPEAPAAPPPREPRESREPRDGREPRGHRPEGPPKPAPAAQPAPAAAPAVAPAPPPAAAPAPQPAAPRPPERAERPDRPDRAERPSGRPERPNRSEGGERPREPEQRQKRPEGQGNNRDREAQR
jgi:hypothetical protein